MVQVLGTLFLKKCLNNKNISFMQLLYTLVY